MNNTAPIFIGKYEVDEVENYGTIQDCVSYISTLKVVGIDIETSRKYPLGTYKEDVYKGGLDPYLTRIVMLQLGDVNKQFVIDVRDFTADDLKPILDVINYNKDIVLVGHNLKFESKHLKHNYGINFHTVYDTMLAEITLYNGLPIGLGLADLAQKYLGVQKKTQDTLFGKAKPPKITLDQELLDLEDSPFITPFEAEENFQIDKSTRMQFINIGNKPFTKNQILYGTDDIIFPVLIRERQQLGRKIGRGVVYNPKLWQKIENHYVLVLADLELKGMPVDKEMWTELHYKNEKIYRQREAIITEWIMKEYPNLASGNIDLFSNAPTCHVQWTSSTQVVNLFKKMGICPKAYSKQTKRVEYTVGAKELVRTLPNALKIKYEKDIDVPITGLDSFKLAYLLFKKSQQAITTFGKAWLKNVHPITGRVHSNYQQILYTSRISSRNPNLQNISGGAWRACFHVPEGSGRVIVNADASAQELRTIADISGDDAFCDFFVYGDEFFGEDFHSYSATKLYRVLEDDPKLIVQPKEIKDKVTGEYSKNPLFTKVDDERRSNAKRITFSLMYGATEFSLASDLGITILEAEKIIKSYFDAFPGLKEYFALADRCSAENDFIPINEFTGTTWFCDFFGQIESLYEEAWSYFPVGYRKLSKKNQEEVKAEVYADNPEVKELFKKAGRLKGSLKRKNLNYRIQGSAAQAMKIAGNIYRKTCIENGWENNLIALVHDELLAESSEQDAKQYGELIKHSVQRAGALLFKRVPQMANYVIRPDWAH